MEFSVLPYNGDSAMKLWPSLAGKAFCLTTASRPADTLFFYDSPPEKGALAAGGDTLPASGGALPAGGDTLPPERGAFGPPPVVALVHGLGDEADSWRHIISPLNSAGYRVLAPDLPGFGRSVAPGRIGFARHVGAVLTLLDAALSGAGGETAAEQGNPGPRVVPPVQAARSMPPVFLAGNSMGAAVAEAAALRRPDLVRGIILLDGSIPGGPSMPGPLALAKLLFSRKWYGAYRNNPEGAWRSLYPYYADLDHMPGADRDFLRSRVMARVESASQERAFFQTQRSLVRVFLTAGAWFAKKIRGYDGKILLVWGEKDRIMPLSSTAPIRALRQDIKLEIISGSGHLPQQEKPAETVRLMKNFLSQGVD